MSEVYAGNDRDRLAAKEGEQARERLGDGESGLSRGETKLFSILQLITILSQRHPRSRVARCCRVNEKKEKGQRALSLA